MEDSREYKNLVTWLAVTHIVPEDSVLVSSKLIARFTFWCWVQPLAQWCARAQAAGGAILPHWHHHDTSPGPSMLTGQSYADSLPLLPSWPQKKKKKWTARRWCHPLLARDPLSTVHVTHFWGWRDSRVVVTWLNDTLAPNLNNLCSYILSSHLYFLFLTSLSGALVIPSFTSSFTCVCDCLSRAREEVYSSGSVHSFQGRGSNPASLVTGPNRRLFILKKNVSCLCITHALVSLAYLQVVTCTQDRTSSPDVNSLAPVMWT